MIYLKTDEEIELMRAANQLVGKTLGELAKHIAPGVNTLQLDKIAEEFIRDNGAVPAFLGYNGFPNTITTSVNEQVVHSIPSAKVILKEGDIVSVVSDASTETVLYAEMPVKTTLKITYTEPGLKGDTATNTLKPATVETGATVRVPLFINEGETIEVDTRDGSYVGRVKA